MIKRTLFIFLLVSLTALTGCETGARSSVRADYYYGGGRYVPYSYYDPFYPRYFYDPYPSFFFGSSFFYGYPYYYPYYPHFIVKDGRAGRRSLRGVPRSNGSIGSSGGMRGPSRGGSTGGGSGGSGGGSGGGRSLR
ncbi:hypothetical protein [Candidatus Manganitrophus noduliformans]|uniref:Lipoprotein n=1 Tax=Candidatus Manganitrophus noduliformans TaxID=2606439 RepID=A0A7X6DV67_9BACT|nr:hypothetical protein [Candidatus Manganitrophus noduliformans]NKE73684.1 hypothetical protein [Candidatus Manganitrophus noduliformans]